MGKTKRLGNGNAWAWRGNYDSACRLLSYHDFYSRALTIDGVRHTGVVFVCDTVPDGLMGRYNNILVGDYAHRFSPEIMHKAVFVSNRVINQQNKAEVK